MAGEDDLEHQSNSEFFEHLNDDEKLKIREQIRGDILDRRILAFDKYADQMGEERRQARSYSKEYGTSFVRTIFLLNGGAIIALMTFIGSMYGKSDLNILIAISLGKRLVPAFYWFASGLVSAALIAALGFFNWNLISNTYAGPGPLFDFLQHRPIEDKPSLHRAALWTFAAAVTLGLASLGSFIRGAYLVTVGFTVLGFE